MYILHLLASTTAVKLFSCKASEPTFCTARITSLSLPTPEGSISMRSGAYSSTTFLSALPKSPTRLQQLFGNLVENAIKYNKPQGRVTVTLQRQRNMVLVKVKDTGIGIPQEHLPRLFERFYRVDSSRSREIGGTGLGLSIVKHLAGLYHGDVSVESVVGEGSVFTVRLPLLEG